MNNIPDISIVVPVYNVEPYLKRCLDSIQNQTFKNWECILIDDGSKDNSGKICDEYMNKDKRFKVIHQDNKGVSSARNAGLDSAKGKYIGFVDSDDWIEPNMYEYLYNSAIAMKSDCVICGFVDQNCSRIKKICSKKEAIKNIFARKGFGGFSCLRLLSAERIKNIRYDTEVPYLEDTKFFYEVFKNCERVYWDNEPLYHYEKREDSVTAKKGLTKEADIAIQTFEQLYRDENDSSIKNAMRASKDRSIIGFAACHLNKNGKDSEKLKLLRLKISKDIWYIIFNLHFSLKQKILAVIILDKSLTDIYSKIREKW